MCACTNFKRKKTAMSNPIISMHFVMKLYACIHYDNAQLMNKHRANSLIDIEFRNDQKIVLHLCDHESTLFLNNLIIIAFTDCITLLVNG